MRAELVRVPFRVAFIRYQCFHYVRFASGSVRL